METRTRTPEWKLDKKETTDLEADNQKQTPFNKGKQKQT